MRIRGTYHIHPGDYQTAKDLGFSHVEVRKPREAHENASLNDYADLNHRIEEAHKIGLNVILDPAFHEYRQDAVNFISKANLSPNDVIYLPDEPNLKSISPLDMRYWHDICERVKPGIKTMCVLSWIRDFNNYANCASIVGIDYYRPLEDIWSLGKNTYNACKLKREHRGELVIVPAIKGNENNLARQYYWWNTALKPEHWYWYAWSGDGGKWFSPDLNARPDLMKQLKTINSLIK